MTYKKILLFLTIVLFGMVLITNGSARSFAQTTGDSTGDNAYTLGPRDILSIRVFGVQELNTRVRISGRGTVTLALLGEVNVNGLTPSQVETKLAELLEKKYLKNAQVTVFIDEYRSSKVAVIGAVARPGSYDLFGKETLLQLISKAGGFSERASNNVIVIRNKKNRIINLDKLMTEGSAELNVTLFPGDIVNVPHERYIDVYIFGEVRRAGALRLKKSGKTTLLKAIAHAGGFSNRARKSSVLIKRIVDGKETKIKVNIKKILKGKKPSFILLQNDVIYVKQSFL
ncbi:MAG: hypothetical protein GY757_51575 [bacterium]|nr:hypothetical protein [bacterium]